jgi:hypothetical protein
MKYPHRVIINDIVQNFNMVGITVKTDKQVFIRKWPLLYYGVIFAGVKSVANIRFGTSMLKGGLTVYYVNIHVFSIHWFCVLRKSKTAALRGIIRPRPAHGGTEGIAD